jgi:hypothetical protein
MSEVDMRTLIVGVTTALLISGCAGGRSTVSENQCVAGDWRTLGYSDGSYGYRSNRLLQHQDACVRHGIIPDRFEYMAGWEQGVREYCEPNNGFSAGTQGYSYENVCPAELRSEFLKAYNDGRELYLARQEVGDLERQLWQRRERLEQVKSEMVSVAAGQLNGELAAAERIELASRLQRLHEEKGRLNGEISDIGVELALKTSELEKLDQALAGVTY